MLMRGSSARVGSRAAPARWLKRAFSFGRHVLEGREVHASTLSDALRKRAVPKGKCLRF